MWLLLLHFPRCCLNTDRGRCIITSVQPSGLQKCWQSTKSDGSWDNYISKYVSVQPVRPQPTAWVMLHNSSPIPTQWVFVPDPVDAGVGGMQNYRARCYLIPFSNHLLVCRKVSKLSCLGPHASKVGGCLTPTGTRLPCTSCRKTTSSPPTPPEVLHLKQEATKYFQLGLGFAFFCCPGCKGPQRRGWHST